MPAEDIRGADWLDRQWNRWSQQWPLDEDETVDDDLARLHTLVRLHSIGNLPIPDKTRERVWLGVTNRIALEDSMTHATPVPTPALVPATTNGHVPRIGTRRSSSPHSEQVRRPRRRRLSLEYAATCALIAILVVSLATGGRFLPDRGSNSSGLDSSRYGGESVVKIPPVKDDVIELTFMRRTLAPGAHWISAPADAITTRLESGFLTYAPANGSEPETVLDVGKSYTSSQPVIFRNHGSDPAVILQGIIPFSSQPSMVFDGVTSEVLAQHLSSDLTGTWAYLQIERYSLDPMETISDVVPANPDFVRTGRAVVMASVDSGAISLSVSPEEGSAFVIPDAEPTTVATAETIANGTIAGAVASPNGNSTDQPISGNGIVFDETIPFVGDDYGAATEGDRSASPYAAGVETPRNGTAAAGPARSEGSREATPSVTHEFGTSATDVVESEETISIRYTGNSATVAYVLVITPGYFDTPDGDPPTDGEDSSNS